MELVEIKGFCPQVQKLTIFLNEYSTSVSYYFLSVLYIITENFTGVINKKDITNRRKRADGLAAGVHRPTLHHSFQNTWEDDPHFKYPS